VTCESLVAKGRYIDSVHLLDLNGVEKFIEIMQTALAKINGS